MTPRPAVFISSTSDLRSARDLVARVLLSMGYDPVYQDIAPTDGGELLGVLRDRMAPCRLMIQLVGHRYGAEPPPEHRPPELGRVSYTQYEALHFERLGRKVIYHFLDATFPTDGVAPEPQDLAALQSAYRRRIEKTNRLHQANIVTAQDLELSIRKVKDELAVLRRQSDRRYRRLLLVAGGALAGIAMVAAGLVGGFRLLSTGQSDQSAKLDRQTAQADDQARQLVRIERLLQARKQSDPQAAPTLSEADRALLERARKSGDLKTRAAASVLNPDGNTDALLDELRARHDAEAFDLAMLQGKRWYFDKLPQPDKAIPHFERAIELRPASFVARNYAAVAHGDARLGDLSAHLNRAVAIGQGALQLVRPTSDDWAMTQVNLGNAYAKLPTGDGAANLAKAIAAYRAALTVYSRADFPAGWAMTQNDLGLAYADLPTGDRAANLARAIAAYQAALEVYTRAEFPADWALTQVNLANAYRNLPTGDRAANLARSVAACQAALGVYTRADFPTGWAGAQVTLGLAYAQLPTDRPANLAKAIAAYEAALQVYTRADFPAEWASAQSDIGIAYRNLPTGDLADNLAKSIAAHEAALGVFTRARFPAEWAKAQNNLGAAYFDLPAGDRAANLAKAIAACQAALQVRTRDADPAAWAMTQLNLARSFADLADQPHEDRPARLRQAIACEKAALLVRTSEAFPRDYAFITRSLAHARQAYESVAAPTDPSFDEIPPSK
jgi:tetratricopeptide (TPR) repeat protein